MDKRRQGRKLINEGGDRMLYIVAVFLLATGYYSFTYGISVWKNENNKLGGIFVVLLSLVGTLFPLIVLFIRK